jgi:hypothetical protein
MTVFCFFAKVVQLVGGYTKKKIQQISCTFFLEIFGNKRKKN